MTLHAPQTPAHGEVTETRPHVAHAQDGAVEAVPAYYTPDTLIADLLAELREARELIAYLTAANRELDDAGKCTWEYYKMQTDRAISQLDAAERKSLQWAFIAVVGWLGFAVCVPVMLGMMQ